MTTSPDGPPQPRQRLDRSVLVGLFLLLGSAPFALLLLAVFAGAVEATGVDPASAEGTERLASVNWLYLVLASLPLVAAGALGTRAWVRRRRTSGLVIAVLATVALLVFLLGPVLASR